MFRPAVALIAVRDLGSRTCRCRDIKIGGYYGRISWISSSFRARTVFAAPSASRASALEWS